MAGVCRATMNCDSLSILLPQPYYLQLSVQGGFSDPPKARRQRLVSVGPCHRLADGLVFQFAEHHGDF